MSKIVILLTIFYLLLKRSTSSSFLIQSPFFLVPLRIDLFKHRNIIISQNCFKIKLNTFRLRCACMTLDSCCRTYSPNEEIDVFINYNNIVIDLSSLILFSISKHPPPQERRMYLRGNTYFLQLVEKISETMYWV